jgi:hypothetical protein
LSPIFLGSFALGALGLDNLGERFFTVIARHARAIFGEPVWRVVE